MKKAILLNLLFWSIYATAQIPFQDHVLHQNPADGLLQPNYATFTDIDGDGDMDVLGCSWVDKKFYWYENTDGQGTYGQQNIILQQYQAAVLQPADLDGDGDVDFVAAVAYPHSKIIWFENTDGHGNFGAEQLITTAVDYPRNLHVADIDNDGDLDLFSASFNDDKLAWYENDGTGNFGAQQIISIDLDQVYNVTTADIDGDGDLDVLSSTSKYSDPKVVWYENTDGQGTFGAANLIAAKRSRNVKTGDFDGDGDIDVVFGYRSFQLYYYENDGTGSSWTQHIVDNTAGPYYVRVADLNNDGNLDIVATDLSDTYWYSNDGNGNFGSKNVMMANQFNWHIETGDMNNDGYPEVICSMENDAEVKIVNNNTGNFNQSFVINAPSSFGESLKAADMDGDGDMDMIAVLASKGEMDYYQNDGQNNFTKIPINLSNISINSYPTPKIKLYDVNDDGFIDIVLVNNFDTDIFTFDGNTSFNLSQNLNQFADVSDADVSDIIPGGYKEIIVLEYTYLYLYSTTDGINYSVNSFFDTGSSHMYDWDSNIVTKDVDNDGLVDIVVSFQSTSKTLAWYKNLGNASFGTEQNILYNSSVKSFKLVDMDNDNDADILVDCIDNSSGARSISKLSNDGSGNFTQNVLYNITPLSYYANDITYGDLDNDGDGDIVYSTNSNIAYLENDGTDNYLAPQDVYSINASFTVQVADVNNDNKNDIIATSVYEGKIFWLENTQGSGSVEEGKLRSIRVYPNPVANLLIIDKENINKIEVLDRTGKLIKTYTDTIEIDFSNYKKGLYLLRITDGDNNVEVQKVLRK